MKRSVILLFTLLGSCLGKVATDTEYHRQLVVEGRIEAGGPAEVMLSENLPFLDVITEQTLEAAVVRYAKVTVTSDDGQSEILTGYYDRNYPTRFVYRSARLHGRTGGTYTLTVDYRGRTCTAVTTVPEPIPLRELRAEPVCDSLFTLQALFDDPQPRRLLRRVPHDGSRRLLPALMGVVDDSVLDNGGSVTLTVNRPLQCLKIEDYKQYFRPGETVDVRFSHISSPTFRFLEPARNEMLNAMNPVFRPTKTSRRTSRATPAAFGAGYGGSYYRITMHHRKTIAKKRPFFRRHSSNESSLHAVWSKRSEKSAALSAGTPAGPPHRRTAAIDRRSPMPADERRHAPTAAMNRQTAGVIADRQFFRRKMAEVSKSITFAPRKPTRCVPMPRWRNTRTRTFQVRVPQGVQVRFLSWAQISC